MRNLLSLSIFLFFLFLYGPLQAQSPSRLMRVHEKGDFARTRELIEKSLEKDTINPAANYLNSILFMLDPFRLNTDSARWFINEALADYKSSDADIIDDLNKAEITIDSLEKQKLIVTADAYDKATAQSTVYALDYFLDYYPEAPQRDRAIFIRDSLAFNNTKDKDTWQAYKAYLETYPDSYYYGEADANYQQLIFLERTLDNRLSSYTRFLREFPDTPHRNEIEWVILTRSCVEHKWENYTAFLDKYPYTDYRKKITDVLYYMDKKNYHARHDELIDLTVSKDSVSQMKTLEDHLLIPFYTDGKYGFMNSRGEIVLENSFTGIEPSYYCGGLDTEWLQIVENGNSQVITRAGEDILGGTEDYSELGNGIVLVSYPHGKYLYHKSGFRLNDRVYQDAQVLGEQFIKVKKDNSWGLLSMLGINILDEKYKSIEMEGPFILVNEGDKYYCTNVAKITEQIKDLDVKLELDFEDYEVLGDSLLLTFNGDKEALYDRKLDQMIPEMEHQIFTLGGSWYVKNSDGYQIYNRNSESLIDQTFEYLDVNNGWMAIKREKDWLLISQFYKVLPKQGLDSIRLINDYTAFIKKGDTIQLIFNNGNIEWLQPDQRLILLSSRENTGKGQPEYVMVFDKKYHKVLSSEGKTLFDGEFDQVGFLADSLFTYSVKGRHGVMDSEGKRIIGPKYESINKQDDLILLLEKGKIGGFNPRTKVLIPPEYDSRLKIFGNYFVIAKGDKVGLINRKNEIVIPIEYEEFMAWNDTSLLARDSTIWSHITYDHEIISSGFMNPVIVAEWGREKFLKVMKDQSFGLLNNLKGEVLETAYNDIVNVGTNNDPVFFAEQHLKTAAFFVVTYFDRWGQTLRSQAYRPEEYSKIYCDR